MTAPTLAHIALVTTDPSGAARLLGELLGLAGGQGLYRVGGAALMLCEPGDARIDGARRTGLHHIGLRGGPGQGELCGVRIRAPIESDVPAVKDGPIERIDHIGIASSDNRAVLATWVADLGCPLESQQTDLELHVAIETFTSDKYGVVTHARPPTAVGGLSTVFVTVGDCELEFLQNFDPAQQGRVDKGTAGNTRQDQGAIATFVAKHGAGLHHLALKARDIDATLRRLDAAGVPLIDRVGRPGGRGSRIGFLHPKALGGVLLHLVERA